MEANEKARIIFRLSAFSPFFSSTPNSVDGPDPDSDPDLAPDSDPDSDSEPDSAGDRERCSTHVPSATNVNTTEMNPLWNKKYLDNTNTLYSANTV